jgi:hypothetical protein
MHLTKTYAASADERATVRAVLARMSGRRSHRGKLVALAILLIAPVWWKYSSGARIAWPLLFLPLLLFALLFGGAVLLRAIRSSLKGLPRRRITVSITDDDFRSGSVFTFRRQWESVYAAETETMFVFSTSQGVGRYLPKRVLSEVELADLRIFLQGKLADRLISVSPNPVYHGGR